VYIPEIKKIPEIKEIVIIPEKIVKIPEIKENNKVNSKVNSIGLLINLCFVTILTLICLWLYNLYIDRKDAKITKMEEINFNNVIPSNVLMETNTF